MIYDNKKQRLSGGTIDLGEKELIAPQVIRFKAKHPSLKKGRVLMCWHGFHFRPAILLYKAKDTVLNDVTIHAQPGMGIVGASVGEHYREPSENRSSFGPLFFEQY